MLVANSAVFEASDSVSVNDDAVSFVRIELSRVSQSVGAQNVPPSAAIDRVSLSRLSESVISRVSAVQSVSRQNVPPIDRVE